jgi:peptidoglycan/LPS O-acetylase OafA/YrhL
VYLVVFFHAGSDRFSGGFIGVDVFFVLSGFLVTTLLLRDLRSGGRVRFGRFYSRRFRRLLPAAFATLIITALVFAAIASPIEVLDAAGGFKAAFLYVTNWYFIAQAASYFGPDVSSNPVLHFWSLAVEEQFYLLWPLLLGGLYVAARRFGSRQWPIMRLAVAAAATASLLWAWHLKSVNPNRAYYGTDARAYQLLAGALLALTPAVIATLARSPRAARWLGAAALAGIILTATTWPSLGPIQRGTLITLITVAVIAAMEALPTGPAPRLLSHEPLIYLGKISYGTYLWHWPVILVITRTFQPSTNATIALTVLIATGLASISYQILEQPVRLSTLLDRHRHIVIATGLATSLIAALVIIPTITNPTTSSAAVTQNLTTAGFTPVPTNINWQAVKNELPVLSNCHGKAPDTCTLVHGTGPHVLLIGDSHAAMMLPTFTELAQADNLTLSVFDEGGCPWQRDLYAVPLDASGVAVTPAQCKQVKDDLYDRVLPALQPDLVVAMNFGYEQPGQPVGYLGPDQQPLGRTSPAYEPWLEKATTDSLDQLEVGGRRVVLIEPIPFPHDMNPLSCLSQAKVVQECRYVTNAEPSGLETLYRKLDKDNDDVWSLDLDHAVCPFLPICDPIVNNQVVKVDKNHLTKDFAVTLMPTVEAFLTQNGIIHR